ncbi:unnamed protein product [Heterosigma akashiwo]
MVPNCSMICSLFFLVLVFTGTTAFTPASSSTFTKTKSRMQRGLVAIPSLHKEISTSYASLATYMAKNSDEEPKKYLYGSGLNGKDISKLTGAEKEDAEWFARQAQREANGELNIFENPLFYVVLFTVVPVAIYLWGVQTCYIPLSEACYARPADF